MGKISQPLPRKILTGSIDKKNHYCVADDIAASNTLLTGMTRSGKSYKLRTMAEVLCGEAPVWILDPEDEFYTLREKYPFLLFGEFGEAPMAVNTARAMARFVIEHNVSAVFSLAQLKEVDQHEWVFNFLDELMNLPRNMWKRAFILADEAHLWAPNAGHGKTNALAAARNLARRGLKRGLIPIWATQRLSSLSVAISASSENLLVGRTTRSADQEQAVKNLGVSNRNKAHWTSKMRRCPKGTFFAVGPAYGEDIVELQTPQAHTTHFSGKIGTERPVKKIPAKLRHLLPKIAEMVNTAAAEIQNKEELEDTVKRLQKALDDGGVIEKGVSEEEAEQMRAQMKTLAQDLITSQAQVLTLTAGLADIKKKSEDITHSAISTLAGPDGSKLAEVTHGESKIMKGLQDAAGLGITQLSWEWCGIFAGRVENSGAFHADVPILIRKGLLKPVYKRNIEMSERGTAFYPVQDKKITQEELLHRLKQSLGDEAYLITEFCAKHNGAWTPRDAVIENTQIPGTRKTLGTIKNLAEIGVINVDKEGRIRAGERILMKG